MASCSAGMAGCGQLRNLRKIGGERGGLQWRLVLRYQVRQLIHNPRDGVSLNRVVVQAVRELQMRQRFD